MTLADRLGVADVQACCLSEGVLAPRCAGSNILHDLLSLQRDLASDGIFCITDILRDRLLSQYLGIVYFGSPLLSVGFIFRRKDCDFAKGSLRSAKDLRFEDLRQHISSYDTYFI